MNKYFLTLAAIGLATCTMAFANDDEKQDQDQPAQELCGEADLLACGACDSEKVEDQDQLACGCNKGKKDKKNQAVELACGCKAGKKDKKAPEVLLACGCEGEKVEDQNQDQLACGCNKNKGKRAFSLNECCDGNSCGSDKEDQDLC